jgi:hypothetical protein
MVPGPYPVLTTDVVRRSSISFSSPMRTRIMLGSTSPNNLSSTTSSSSASRIGRSVPWKSSSPRVRLAVPARAIRSSLRSTRVSNSTVDSAVMAGRSVLGVSSIKASTSGGVSVSAQLASFSLITRRSSETSSAASVPGRSSRRCSTRPVSAIMTSIRRVVDSGTSSRWRTRERDRLGYCTMATWRVSCASRRTVRCTTSSRSTAPSMNRSIARRSAGESGLIRVSRSTNNRYPRSVGTRPALVCGCRM